MPITNDYVPLIRKLVCVLLGLICIQYSSATAQDNILVIVADDLGAESLNSYAGDFQTPPFGIRPQTPTLDKLAKTPGRSVRFTNCWANPACSPTRACLLTGKHTFRTGVTWGDPFNGPQYSVAQAMQLAGYRTAAFGKWHLNPNAPGENANPIVLGFDRFEGSTVNCCFNNTDETYFNWTKRIETANSLRNVRVDKYAPIEFVESAAKWINKQDARPWFVYLAFHTVHAPWHVPPLELHTYGNVGGTQNKYAAMIQAMDTVIGQLVREIDLRNTTVMFIGDNGNAPAVSQFWGPDDRAKTTPYQGGVHVPCFVYRSTSSFPLSPTTTHDALIHAVDFYDTIIELTGNDPDLLSPNDAATDSRSFAPYVFNPDLPVMNVHTCNYAQLVNMGSSGFRHAIRDQQYKLIQPGFNAAEEFYDLLSDPLELVDLMPNLTQDQAKIVNELTIKRQELWDSDD